MTGTPPYVAGVGLSFYLFPQAVATAAVCFLAVGDVAATTVGERYGRTKIGGKSLEGTIAFVIAASGGALLLGRLLGTSVNLGILLPGAVVAACVELLLLPVNDNFSIPVVSGSAMLLLSHFCGRA